MRHTSALFSLVTAAVIGSACTQTVVSTPPAGTPSSVVASSSPSASDFVPSLAPGATFDTDEELGARFPRSIAGSPVEVQTIGAETFLEFQRQDDPARAAEFEELITSLGVDVGAVSVGGGGFEYQGSPFVLEALRVEGADASRLLEALVSDTQLDAADPSAVETTTGTAGGKPVTIVTVPGQTTTYFYGEGDVVWTFDSDDPAVADVVMGAIP